MPPFKKILFPAFSIFLVYQTIELLKMFDNQKAENFSITVTFLLAFALNLFITGIFAFVGFAFSSSSILPRSYYKIRNNKRLNLMCNVMGVKYFRAMLLFAFWGKEKNRKKFFNGTKSGIQNFIHQTKQSEFGHFGALLFVFIATVYLFINGYILLFVLSSTINFIGNFYPILLQRLHRSKIERIFN